MIQYKLPSLFSHTIWTQLEKKMIVFFLLKSISSLKKEKDRLTRWTTDAADRETRPLHSSKNEYFYQYHGQKKNTDDWHGYQLKSEPAKRRKKVEGTALWYATVNLSGGRVCIQIQSDQLCLQLVPIPPAADVERHQYERPKREKKINKYKVSFFFFFWRDFFHSRMNASDWQETRCT